MGSHNKELIRKNSFWSYVCLMLGISIVEDGQKWTKIHVWQYSCRRLIRGVLTYVPEHYLTLEIEKNTFFSLRNQISGVYDIWKPSKIESDA